MGNCQKEHWHGRCCCNCENHLEDFYHCTTLPNPKYIDGCVCGVHKGWICRMGDEGTGEVRFYSGWAEHGMCEMHVLKQNK